MITHVGMGLVCLTFPVFVSATWQAICLALLFTGILVLFRMKPELLWGGATLLPASRCHSEGEFYFVGGVAFALLFAREARFVYFASVLMLTFADAAAAVVGKCVGKRHCWGNEKTLEGSLAFCAISFLCLLGAALITRHTGNILMLSVACLLATMSEGIAERGSDNLWIPLVSVVCLQITLWWPHRIPTVAGLAMMAIILSLVVLVKIQAFTGRSGSRLWRYGKVRLQQSSRPASHPHQPALVSEGRSGYVAAMLPEESG